MASIDYMNSNHELLNYLKKHNITNFARKKNGSPDMRNIDNKIHYKNMIKENSNFTNENNNIIHSDNVCPICYDEINNGKVELKCEHTFCLDCFTKFYLKNNTCPMCRNIFIDKKIELMSDSYADSISSQSINWGIFISPDNSGFTSYSQFLKNNLEHMNSKNIKNTIKSVEKATKELINVTCSVVRNHYETQLFS